MEGSSQSVVLPDTDYVRIEGFTLATHEWLIRLVESEYGGDPKLLVNFDYASSLFFRLRKLPDDAFPGGKWATLQHLESCIEDAIRND